MLKISFSFACLLQSRLPITNYNLRLLKSKSQTSQMRKRTTQHSDGVLAPRLYYHITPSTLLTQHKVRRWNRKKSAKFIFSNFWVTISFYPIPRIHEEPQYMFYGVFTYQTTINSLIDSEPKRRVVWECELLILIVLFAL